MIPRGPEEFNNNSTPVFDVDAANQERLGWKLGSEVPTERALGVQEGFTRQYEADMAAKKAEDEAAAEARKNHIESRLGNTALVDTNDDASRIDLSDS